MQRQQVLGEIKGYIAQHALEGEETGLDETTPLLEWGILSSFEIVKLLSFIEKRFVIQVPAEKIVAEYFTNLVSITDLVMETEGMSAE
jgi:acyl carrier protein